MIQLYDPQTTDFTLNGHVLTDISNDVVTWKMNTTFELSFDYPLFSPHGAQLAKEMIVTVPTPDKFEHDQGFRINSVIKSMGIVTVHAYHLFWDLNQNFIEDINIVGDTGAEAIEHIMTNTQYDHTFRYTSDLVNTANARQVRMSAIKALIGDDDNSFITRFGGQFEWDNFEFNVQSSIGQNRGVVFRNGKNLTGYTFEENIDSVVTRIMPEGYDGLLLPEKYVDAGNIGNYLNPRIAVIEYSDIKAIDPDATTTDEDAVPLEEAYEKLRTAAKAEFTDNNLDKPTNTISLNVILLENTEEYKDKGQFTKVYPGDTARFVHTDDNVDTEAQLTGYTWQPSNQEYLTVTFDSVTKTSPTLSQTISRVTKSISSVSENVKAVAANGDNGNNWGENAPVDGVDSAKEGDLWFEQRGSTLVMWIYENGHWVEEASDLTGEEIKKKVDEQFEGLATWKANVQSDLDLIKANNATFNAQVEALNVNYASMQESVAKIDASVKADISTLGAQAQSAIDALAKLQADQSDMSAKLTTVTNQTDELNGKFTQAVTTTQLADAQTSWTNAQRLITEGMITDEVTKVNQSVDEKTKDFVTEEIVNNKITTSETGTKQVISETFENARIGSRNYLPETSFETIKKWSTSNALHQMSIDSDNKLNGNNSLRITASAPGGGGDAGLIYTGFYGSYNKGDIFKLSFWAKSISGNAMLHTELHGGIGATSVTLTTEWKRYVVDLTYSNDTKFYFWLTGAGVCLINSPQLERSDIVTDWHQAQEDTASVGRVNEIESNLDGTTQTIKGLQGDISINKATADSASQAIANIQGDLVRTTQTATGAQTLAENTATEMKTEVNTLAGQFSVLSTSGDNLMPGGDFEYETINQKSNYWNSNGTIVSNPTPNEPTNPHPNSSNQVMQIVGSSTLNVDVTSNILIPVEPKEYFCSFDTKWSMPSQTGKIWYYVFEYDANKNLIGPRTIVGDSDVASWKTSTGLYTPDKQVKYIALDITKTKQFSNGDRVWFDNVIFRPNSASQADVSTLIAASQKSITLQVSEGVNKAFSDVENADHVAALLNLSSDGMLIEGYKLHITAQTEIEQAAIKSAAIESLEADKIRAGTLNANLINVVNLNAASIVTGILSGANLSLNLNTGEVEFQKGRIHSASNNIDININKGYVSVADASSRVLLKGGELQFTETNMFSLEDSPYMRISNNLHGLGGVGVYGRSNISLTINNGGAASSLAGNLMGAETFRGVSVQDGSITKVGGANSGVLIRGGSAISGLDPIVNTTPFIGVGVTGSNGWGGQEIHIVGQYTRIPSASNVTSSNSPNLVVGGDGTLMRSTSAAKYKTDIIRSASMDMANKLIGLPYATWADIAETKRYDEEPDRWPKPERNFGMIAEDLAGAGLEDLVIRNNGELEGIQYDRIVPALLPLLKNMKDRIGKLEEQLNGQTATA